MGLPKVPVHVFEHSCALTIARVSPKHRTTRMCVQRTVKNATSSAGDKCDVNGRCRVKCDDRASQEDMSAVGHLRRLVYGRGKRQQV